MLSVIYLRRSEQLTARGKGDKNWIGSTVVFSCTDSNLIAWKSLARISDQTNNLRIMHAVFHLAVDMVLKKKKNINV